MDPRQGSDGLEDHLLCSSCATAIWRLVSLLRTRRLSVRVLLLLALQALSFTFEFSSSSFCLIDASSSFGVLLVEMVYVLSQIMRKMRLVREERR